MKVYEEALGCFLAMFLIVCGWFGVASMLAFWTQHELEFWVSYAKGTPVAVDWWVAFLASLLVPLAFVADVISSIVRLFV